MPIVVDRSSPRPLTADTACGASTGYTPNCCYSAKSETSVLLIGANSNGYNNVFGISRFVQ